MKAIKLLISTFCVVVMSLGVIVAMDKSGEESFFSSVKDAVCYSTDKVSDNIELVRAISCLLYLPDIVFVDSNKPFVVRSSAVSALVAENIKLLHYLFSKKETRPINELLWHMPKAALYSLSELYDILRFVDAENVARINNENASVPVGKVNLLKVNQGVQLAIEVILRSLICINSYQQASVVLEADKNKLSFWLAELADVVELWRLMSRYSAHFKMQSNKRGKKRKQPSGIMNGMVQAIDEDEILGEVADFKNNLLSLVGAEK